MARSLRFGGKPLSPSSLPTESCLLRVSVVVIVALVAASVRIAVAAGVPYYSPPNLTPAEKKLIKAAKNGQVADYRRRSKELDDPAKGASWSRERTIRAEVIYALAVGDNPQVHAKGVQIWGAKIVGPLDLRGAKNPPPLILIDCFVDEPINLMDADALSVALTGSHVTGIEADGLHIRGDVLLRDAFHATGEVRLSAPRSGESSTARAASSRMHTATR